MAEYEDCDVRSPGPNSSLTLEDLQGRVHGLVESLGQAREMATRGTESMRTTLERLDGVVLEMRSVNRELRDTREEKEKKKASVDKEMDPQTEKALTHFLTEHLKPSTTREDANLCRQIRRSYPDAQQPSVAQRSTRTQTDYALDVIYLF